MNDSQILEEISRQYGDQLEALNLDQKTAVLARLAYDAHGYAAPPDALIRQINFLSHRGRLILMEAVFAQLKAAAETKPQ